MRFIRDEEFIRGNCPMTKEEVRILSVTKLEIEEEHRLLDIGSGTGSVSIQMSMLCSKGQVISIERDAEALEVIKSNKDKFKADNLTIIEGDASEVYPYIEGEFDGIFIGGSGGSIEAIIKDYYIKLKTYGRFVLNFITLDNVYKAINALKELGCDVECSQISVSKTKGKSLMLFANNPIFIVTAIKKV